MKYTIYTDGSCLRNPEGPGGWSYVVVGPDGTQVSHGAGGEPVSTNNRMELMAAIEALRALAALPHGSEATIVSDSKYVIEGITDWIKGWKKRAWRTADKKPVKNEDLWRILDDLNSRSLCSWKWVRGHNGNHWNEICDTLAVEQSTLLDARR